MFTLTDQKTGKSIELSLDDIQMIDSAMCHHRDEVLVKTRAHTDNPAAVQRLKETADKLRPIFVAAGIYGE